MGNNTEQFKDEEGKLVLGLQYFADPAPQDPPADPPPTDPAPTGTDPAGDDVQTQAQKIADAIVAKKLKGMPTKDELKAFKEWQDSQKTPEEKDSEELARYKREADEYKAKATAFEREKAVIKSGVSADFAEFVAFQVGRSVDENTDFEEALSSYLKANPQYLDQANSPAPNRTGMPQGNPAPVAQHKAYLDQKYEKNPYYKK